MKRSAAPPHTKPHPHVLVELRATRVDLDFNTPCRARCLAVVSLCAAAVRFSDNSSESRVLASGKVALRDLVGDFLDYAARPELDPHTHQLFLCQAPPAFVPDAYYSPQRSTAAAHPRPLRPLTPACLPRR